MVDITGEDLAKANEIITQLTTAMRHAGSGNPQGTISDTIFTHGVWRDVSTTGEMNVTLIGTTAETSLTKAVAQVFQERGGRLVVYGLVDFRGVTQSAWQIIASFPVETFSK